MTNDRGEGRRKAINGVRLFGCALTLVVQFCSEAAPLSPSAVCRDSSGSRLTRVTMPCAAELVNGEGGAIKVGTTGTIGSLVTRELDTIKVAPQVATTPRLRCQSSPVSVPCGASPRKIILRKSSSNATTSSNSSSSSNGRTDRVIAEEACKPRRSSQRSAFNSPMLPSDGVLVDRSPNVDKAKKKGNVCGVEVVDVKCGNPMSSRLRKLGFSKLSETFA